VANQSREKAQVQRRLEEIFDAAEKKDLARLDSYHAYGPAFTKFSPGELGREDAAASRRGEHEGLATLSDLVMRADDLKIDVFGDLAIATFILNSRFKHGTDSIEKKNRSTLVFVKDQGEWKITHEHFSAFKGVQ
jgi:ketosteroid isomerase-like protein